MLLCRLFDEELDYVEKLIDEDLRNNSAWNQRYFVLANTTGFTDDVIEREVTFAVSKIKIAKNNESSWNFLRGVLFHDKRGLRGNIQTTSFCENLYKNSNRSPFLLALIIDICDEAVIKNQQNELYNAERGADLCKAMSDKYDKIRSKYWNYIASKFTPKSASCVENLDNPKRKSTDSLLQNEAAE